MISHTDLSEAGPNAPNTVAVIERSLLWALCDGVHPAAAVLNK
jgi:hypothetical protein